MTIPYADEIYRFLLTVPPFFILGVCVVIGIAILIVAGEQEPQTKVEEKKTTALPSAEEFKRDDEGNTPPSPEIGNGDKEQIDDFLETAMLKALKEGKFVFSKGAFDIIRYKGKYRVDIPDGVVGQFVFDGRTETVTRETNPLPSVIELRPPAPGEESSN